MVGLRQEARPQEKPWGLLLERSRKREGAQGGGFWTQLQTGVRTPWFLLDLGSPLVGRAAGRAQRGPEGG